MTKHFTQCGSSTICNWQLCLCTIMWYIQSCCVMLFCNIVIYIMIFSNLYYSRKCEYKIPWKNIITICTYFCTFSIEERSIHVIFLFQLLHDKEWRRSILYPVGQGMQIWSWNQMYPIIRTSWKIISLSFKNNGRGSLFLNMPMTRFFLSNMI